MAHENFDYMTNIKTTEISLFDGQGSVQLVDFSPRMCPVGHSPEFSIVQAARVSYGQGVKTPKEDAGLITYLIDNGHTSPLEMASCKFRVVVPKAIAIQLLRHRTAKFIHVNELSQRYMEITDKIGHYDPLKWSRGVRVQSNLHHQGSDERNENPELLKVMELANQKLDETRELYHKMIELGLGKEIARFYLPMSENTVMYLEFDLNNLFKFLTVRDESHAQLEIQEMARAMSTLAEQCFPNAFAAHYNNKHGISFSEIELKAINANDFIGVGMSKRRRLVYQEKIDKLGLCPT